MPIEAYLFWNWNPFNNSWKWKNIPFILIIHALLYLSFMAKEMLGELFTPVETPEAPNRGFFKGLFGGGAQSLDREELCKLLLFFIFLVFLPQEASDAW